MGLRVVESIRVNVIGRVHITSDESDSSIEKPLLPVEIGHSPTRIPELSKRISGRENRTDLQVQVFRRNIRSQPMPMLHFVDEISGMACVTAKQRPLAVESE